MPHIYDCILVGSGLGSLTCAVDLARHGLDVLLLEQAPKPGGYAGRFERDGFSFDISLHHIGGLEPGNMTHGVLASLGVLEKLQISRRPSLFRVEYPDLALTLPNEQSELLELLGERFPKESSKLGPLFDRLLDLKEDIVEPTMNAGSPQVGRSRLSNAIIDKTFAQLLREHIDSVELEAILGQMWQYVGLPPSRASASFSTCVFASSYLEGAFSIRGGGQALTDAFVTRLQELGGALRTRARVAQILVNEQGVCGVELDDGEQLSARRVVSGVDPIQTFTSLVPSERVSKVFRFRLEKMEPALSAFALYLGIDCDAASIGITEDNTFVSYGLDHEDAYQRALAVELERTDWCLTSYARSDSSLAPQGSSVLCLTELCPAGDWLQLDGEAYAERKGQAREKILAKVRQRFPELADHILVEAFSTPKTMARYTANHAGSLFGFAQTIDQSNSRRLRNRTPVPGLFLTGAWTWSGGGYEGAMMSGVQSARALLDEVELESTALPVGYRPDRADGKSAQKATRKNLAHSKSTAEPKEEFPYARTVRIYNSDLGAGARTDASSCLRFMDRGRVEAIEELCARKAVESWLTRYTVNVYRLDAVFGTPAAIGEVLDVHSDVFRRSAYRAAFDCRIATAVSGDVVTESTVEIAFMGPDGKLTDVPEEIEKEPLRGGGPLVEPTLRFTPKKLAPAFPFNRRFRVFFEDTDTQSIAYHVTYVRFCEWTLLELFNEVRSDLSLEKWLVLHGAQITRLTARYMQSAKLGDVLEVQTRLRETSENGRALFEHSLVHADNPEAVTSDVLIEVSFRTPEGHPLPVPKALVERLR